VENAKADLLMFAGKQDNIWNTHDGCVEIVNALMKADYPYKYELIAYEDAGHPFYAPYIIPNTIYEPMRIAPRLSAFTGGTLAGNNEAVVDSWEKTLRFFTEDYAQSSVCTYGHRPQEQL
jgi:dienelactone hydrolase